MVKVAINHCYGGFHLSQAVYQYLIDKKGWQISPDDYDPVKKLIKYNNRDKEYYCVFYDQNRANLDLIEAIETLGLDKAANLEYSEIILVEIPNDIKWYISEYDGWEEIHEEHRIWR